MKTPIVPPCPYNGCEGQAHGAVFTQQRVANFYQMWPDDKLPSMNGDTSRTIGREFGSCSAGRPFLRGPEDRLLLECDTCFRLFEAPKNFKVIDADGKTVIR